MLGTRHPLPARLKAKPCAEARTTVRLEVLRDILLKCYAEAGLDLGNGYRRRRVLDKLLVILNPMVLWTQLHILAVFLVFTLTYCLTTRYVVPRSMAATMGALAFDAVFLRDLGLFALLWFVLAVSMKPYHQRPLRRLIRHWILYIFLAGVLDCLLIGVIWIIDNAPTTGALPSLQSISNEANNVMQNIKEGSGMLGAHFMDGANALGAAAAAVMESAKANYMPDDAAGKANEVLRNIKEGSKAYGGVLSARLMKGAGVLGAAAAKAAGHAVKAVDEAKRNYYAEDLPAAIPRELLPWGLQPLVTTGRVVYTVGAFVLNLVWRLLPHMRYFVVFAYRLKRHMSFLELAVFVLFAMAVATMISESVANGQLRLSSSAPSERTDYPPMWSYFTTFFGTVKLSQSHVTGSTLKQSNRKCTHPIFVDDDISTPLLTAQDECWEAVEMQQQPPATPPTVTSSPHNALSCREEEELMKSVWVLRISSWHASIFDQLKRAVSEAIMRCVGPRASRYAFLLSLGIGMRRLAETNVITLTYSIDKDMTMDMRVDKVGTETVFIKMHISTVPVETDRDVEMHSLKWGSKSISKTEVADTLPGNNIVQCDGRGYVSNMRMVDRGDGWLTCSGHRLLAHPPKLGDSRDMICVVGDSSWPLAVTLALCYCLALKVQNTHFRVVERTALARGPRLHSVAAFGDAWYSLSGAQGCVDNLLIVDASFKLGRLMWRNQKPVDPSTVARNKLHVLSNAAHFQEDFANLYRSNVHADCVAGRMVWVRNGAVKVDEALTRYLASLTESHHD